MEAVSADEKIAYFKSLIALANVDGEVSDGELEIIRQAATLYGCTLRKSYLKNYDVEKLADQIHNSSLRTMLLNDFKRLLDVDETRNPKALGVVLFYARHWKMAPPHWPDVDWRKVRKPGDVAEVSRAITKQSARREAQTYQAVGPGFQWLAVFAGAGVIFTLTSSILVGLYIAGFGLFDATFQLGDLGFNTWVFGVIAACFFFSGLIVALLSPGRTIREPAIGAVIPLLLLTTVAGTALYQRHETLKALEKSTADLPWFDTLGPLILAACVAYLLAIFGAWIGEFMDRSRAV